MTDETHHAEVVADQRPDDDDDGGPKQQVNKPALALGFATADGRRQEERGADP